MGTAAALVAYAIVIAAAGAAIWRRPVVALYVFVVGLAAHNAVMAALYAAGLHGTALTVVTAWKEILLAIALVRVAWEAARLRRLPFQPGAVDLAALVFGALGVIYALIPQDVLGGEAGTKAVALGVRHDLVPVGAWFLGRSLVLSRAELGRLAWTLLGVAAAVAVIGLVDVYAVSISWWRGNGVVDYFHKHLGYDYHGTGGLPENFVYNVGGDKPFLRRLVSTFLSPLASAYLFVVALLVAAAVLRRWLAFVLGVVVAAGLLWTFSRSSLIALAAGFVVLALVRRRPEWLAAAALTIGVAIAWVHVFPSVAPTGNWTKADLAYQHDYAEQHPGADPSSATSQNEPSIRSHLTSLRDGFKTMVEHPQGYGVGNVGQTASRTETPLKAGESNYTELGVELGVVGALAWLAWVVLIALGLVRVHAIFAAAFIAVAVLAIQTDVIGDPWVAYCVWGLAGAVLSTRAPSRATPAPARAERSPRTSVA
jgi:O-Antigen ligase